MDRHLTSFRELQLSNASIRDTLALLFDVVSPAPFPQAPLAVDVMVPPDWEACFTTAVNLFVAPLFYRRLVERKLDAQVPADVLEALQAVYLLNQQRNLQLKEILEESLAILNEGGVTPVLLKGSHALPGLLPYSDCRMMGDIDLLVFPEEIEKSRELLLARGYYHENNDLKLALQPEEVHIEPLFHPSGYAYLELHRRPNFQSRHPELIMWCIDRQNLQLHTTNTATFYAFPDQFLYLYNQVHHYYGHMRQAFYPDIRYIFEQAQLLQSVGSAELEAVYQLVQKKAPDFAPYFALQNALVHDLLRISIVPKYRRLDKPARRFYRNAILLLLSDKAATRRQRVKVLTSFIPYLARNMVKYRWWRRRLFNWQWYKTRPAKLRSRLKQNSLLP